LSEELCVLSSCFFSPMSKNSVLEELRVRRLAGCMSETCCTRLAEIQDAKVAKNSPSGHNRTTLSGYVFAIKARIDNRKNLLNSNISSACTHNMVNFGPLVPEIVSLVWAPQQISTAFASWLRYCSDVAQRKSTKLCTMFGHLVGCNTIYTFSGALAPGRPSRWALACILVCTKSVCGQLW